MLSLGTLFGGLQESVTHTMGEPSAGEGTYTVNFSLEGSAPQAVNADLVVVAVGAVPNSALFNGKLSLTSSGHVVVDERLQTSAKDVFAVVSC